MILLGKVYVAMTLSWAKDGCGMTNGDEQKPEEHHGPEGVFNLRSIGRHHFTSMMIDIALNTT